MKNIITLLLIFLQVSFVYAKEQTIFYQKPNYENFIGHIREYDRANNIKNNIGYEPAYLSVFIGNVIDNHPEYIKRLIKEKDRYSKNIQVSIDVAIQHSGTAEGREKSKKYTNPSNPYSYIFIQPIESIEMLLGNMFLADCLWQTFYATGNNEYLKIILKYLSEQSLMIRTFAFEIINRDRIVSLLNNVGIDSTQSANDNKEMSDGLLSKDIFEQIDKMDPKGKKHLKFSVLACYSILKSLQINKTHSDISRRIKEIIKQHPELDYAKDVKL